MVTSQYTPKNLFKSTVFVTGNATGSCRCVYTTYARQIGLARFLNDMLRCPAYR